MDELISIIIPIYNNGNIVSKCLDSIISQTYKNLEILVIDDGSTDNTKDICVEYQTKDNRIKYVHQEHIGLSLIRNKSIEMINGDYFTFIDSDDYLLSDNYIYEMYEQIKKFNVKIVISGYTCIKNEKIINKVLLYNETKKLVFDDIKNDFVRENGLIAFHNDLIKKDVKNDIVFKKGLEMAEDFEARYHLLNKVQEFVYFANTDYGFVQYDKSLTHGNSLEKVTKYLDRAYIVLDIILKNDNSLKDSVEIRKMEKMNYALTKLSLKKSFKQFKSEYNEFVKKYQIGEYDFSKSRESKGNKLRMKLLVNNRLFLYYLLNNIINIIR